ncbi:O-antigen ligase domain-containing protein [Leptospira bouyouniensis]|uniref:O-antigen ligase domain-containing protein n=1 Tax=Leptospira bouyouniensis TaxID=2484911 RepID=A0A7I0ILJ8_9LEPT|nr:O-antigen ligase family protein [Leptospira bouyouniensis]TGL04176.1 O-antigen ligase domain-containing protein [Leptospira bouyouniensis]
MIGKETFHTFSFVFLAVFFVVSPFSISLSQISCGLSLFFLFLDHIKRKECPSLPLPLIFWAGLYFSFLLIPLLHLESFHWKQNIIKSEFGDSWMGLLLLHQNYLNNAEKKKLKSFVIIGGMFLILSGVVSLLTHYRLAPFVMDGFRYVEGKRLPHLLTELKGISFYLPIGFQSTHLTYGGLLAVYLPSVFVMTFRLVQKKRVIRKHSILLIGNLILSALGLVLLFLNQSRSIWIGFLLGMILLIHKRRTSFKRLFPWIIALTFLILSILILFYHTNWLFQRAIDDIFAKRSLENQRVWIHKMNFSILKEHFGLGIGAGNYETSFIDVAIPIVDSIPELYYDLMITPKSHAHFDFLHGILLGGVTAFCFSIAFLWSITRSLELVPRHFFFYIGIFVIIIAGSFQCYLLDDEVLLPFMGILALMPTQKMDLFLLSQNLKRYFMKEGIWLTLFRMVPFSFGIALLWISLSLTATYLWSRTENKELSLHRTRTQDNFPSPLTQMSINAKTPIPLPFPTKELYFKLSGCLDKEMNFKRNLKPRQKPIRLEILWDKDKQSYLPNSITIEIRKRESFDQDKEYRVHVESVVRKFTIPITGNDHRIEVDPREFENTLPEFVDFGFLYRWQGDAPLLPRIHMQGNCD